MNAVAEMFRAPGDAVFMVVHHGRVLMERCPKKAAMFGGTWFLPGGKLNDGEKPFDACARVMLEKAGVQLLSATHLPVLDGGIPGRLFFPLYPFHVTEWRGDFPPQSTGGDAVLFEWFSLAEAACSPVVQVRMMIAALPPALF